MWGPPHLASSGLRTEEVGISVVTPGPTVADFCRGRGDISEIIEKCMYWSHASIPGTELLKP